MRLPDILTPYDHLRTQLVADSVPFIPEGEPISKGGLLHRQLGAQSRLAAKPLPPNLWGQLPAAFRNHLNLLMRR